MVHYTNTTHRIFAIGMLPSDHLPWGRQAGSADDRSRYLCNSTDTPLTIWVIGKVSSIHLYNGNDNPSLVSVAITPVLRCDAIKAFDLIHSLEHLYPEITLTTEDVNTNLIWFSKWMKSENNKVRT